MDSGLFAIEHPVVANSESYDGLDEFVVEGIRGFDLEMRRQPAHMVYEMINARLGHRPPGMVVDREALGEAAAKISVGIPV